MDEDKILKETYKFILEIIYELGSQYIKDLTDKKWYKKIYYNICNDNTFIYKRKIGISINELTKVLKRLNILYELWGNEIEVIIFKDTFEKLIEKANVKTHEPVIYLSMYNEDFINYLKSIPRKRKEYFRDKGFDVTYQDGLRASIDINAYEDMRRVLKNDRRVYTK